MVDHFGRSICNRETLRGPQGDPGIEILCDVMPGTMISNLRQYDELYCFTVTDQHRDFTEKFTKWMSCSEIHKENLNVIKGDVKLKELNYNRRWSVSFESNTILKSRGLTFATSYPSSAGFYDILFGQSQIKNKY